MSTPVRTRGRLACRPPSQTRARAAALVRTCMSPAGPPARAPRPLKLGGQWRSTLWHRGQPPPQPDRDVAATPSSRAAASSSASVNGPVSASQASSATPSNSFRRWSVAASLSQRDTLTPRRAAASRTAFPKARSMVTDSLSTCTHTNVLVLYAGHGPRGAGRTGVPVRSGEGRSGEASEGIEQLVLELPVTNRGVRIGSALMVPVATGRACFRILAGGEPLLGQVAEPKVIGCPGPAHLCGHPARVDRIAERVRPDPGDGSGAGGTG